MTSRAFTSRFAAILTGALAVAGATACSRPQPPTAPDPPITGGPPPPEAPANIHVSAVDHLRREIVIEWDPVPAADRYLVEHWKLFEPGSPVTSLQTAGRETTMTLRDVPGDVLSVAVSAQNANGTSPRGRSALAQIIDVKFVVEALFFGTGPYGTGLFSVPPADVLQFRAPGVQNHVGAGRMLGWSSGVVPVRVESGITDDQFAALGRVLDHIRDLTGGDLRPEIVERSDLLPGTLVPGEVHVIVRDDIGDRCGPPPVDGCAQQRVDEARLTSATVFLRRSLTPAAIVHEIGHALLGLHHVWHVQIEPRPVMAPSGAPSTGEFSALEIDAIRAVYATTLRHGANRDAFRALALIH